MAHPPSTWKKVELIIAQYLGGQRRGADFAERDGSQTGKDDIIIPGWSIEVKHDKDASYGLACSALDQVDQVYGVVHNETLPVAIIHKGGLRIIEESVVCIRPNVMHEIYMSNVSSWRSYRSVYTSYTIYWKHIVSGVTQPNHTYSDGTDTFPDLLVQRIHKGDEDIELKPYPMFIAMSLPNFKEYILPLRQ